MCNVGYLWALSEVSVNQPMVLKQWKKANLNDQAEAAWQKWKQKYYTEETFTESYFKSHKSVIHSRLLQTFPCSTISLFYTISAIRYNAEFHQTQNTECRRRTSSINQSRFIHLECSINHKIAHVLSADDQVSALDMSLWNSFSSVCRVLPKVLTVCSADGYQKKIRKQKRTPENLQY